MKNYVGAVAGWIAGCLGALGLVGGGVAGCAPSSDDGEGGPSLVMTPGGGAAGASGGGDEAGANGGGGGGMSFIPLGGMSTGTGASGGECAESTATADLVPANLLFVVDKSGSMNCNQPPTDPTCDEPKKVVETEPSKWEITESALTGPDGALYTLAGQSGISTALIAFPLDDNCEVPEEGQLTVPMGVLTSDHLDVMTSGLNLAASGNTPLAGAAIRGLEALRLGIHAGELEGDNYLVVMTDGAETCQPGAVDDLLTFVEEAEQFYGIRTYAIGAPGSEASRSLLSEIAIRGGTRKSATCLASPSNASESCHIDLTESTDFQADLGSEFKGITAATAQTCEYDVPQNALIDTSKVNVEVTLSAAEAELIAQDPPAAGESQCDSAEGWQFSEDGSQIVLCGSVCEDVLSDPGAKVRVVFGCRETLIR